MLNKTRSDASLFLFSMYIGECSTGSLRLVDGQSKREGRLEVCFLNHWNTACGLFSDANARVTCRQLGYTLDGKQSPIVRVGY